jgi:transcriptional regulator with XRE-family HTH domain
MTDNSNKKKFIELRGMGLTYNAIAEELGVSTRTLIRWSKDFEDEIANLKATELEALQEEYYMKKEKKIILFGGKLKDLINELSKRDLSEVPTEKLFDLMIKYSIFLSKEEVELTFTQKMADGEVFALEPMSKEWKG